MWFTGQSGYYGRLVPATGDMKVWKAPRGSGPYGITTTPRGDVYYASLAGNHIARIDTETGVATVIEPPTPRQGARRVWSDSRGRIWVSYWNTGQVGMYDPATERVARMEAARQFAARVFGVGRQRGQGVADRMDEQRDRPLRPGHREVRRASRRTASSAGVRQMLGRAGEAWGAESGNERLVMIPAN